MTSRGQRFLTIATKRDWETVLSTVEKLECLKYVRSGTFSEVSEPYLSYFEIAGFAEARVGEAPAEDRFLMMERGTPIVSRLIVLNTGEHRRVVDHENNPESVILSPGGILLAGKCVIQGEVSKLSQRVTANRLFKVVGSQLKKEFTPVGAYWVGKDARALGTQGYRLTGSVGSPKEYDLALM